MSLVLILGLMLLHSYDAVSAIANTNRNNYDVLQEFCNLETFRPECWKSEVIVIQEAIYGRRRAGRCIEAENSDLAEDPRYLGCYADVLGLLDAKCSGKKACEVRIPDPDLEQETPCVKSLKMFLEVRYTCVEVVEPDRSCVVSVTSSAQHIAAAADVDSRSTQSNMGCGTKTQPWMLEAPAGQRINISLLDFTAAARSTSQHLSHSSSSSISSDSCVDENHQYGYIIDKSSVNKKNVSVCQASSNRQTHVYLTTSNQVQLTLANRQNNFLLRTDAVGCSDLVPPDDAWMRRSDDELTIGCYTSRQTWQLKCQHRRWIGVLSNCTKSFRAVAVEKELKHSTAFTDHQVLAIVAVSFVGLAICLTIICCGIYCIRRYSQTTESYGTKSGMKYNAMPMPDPIDSVLVRGGRGQLVPGTTRYDDVTPVNNHDVSTGRTVGGAHAQYFVLDQDYVNRENVGV